MELTKHLDRLTLYAGVAADPVAVKTAAVFSRAAMARSGRADVIDDETRALYREVQRALVSERHDGAARVTFWQAHVARAVAESENPFSLRAERGAVTPALADLAAAEMPSLRALYAADWNAVAAVFEDAACVAALPAADVFGDADGAGAACEDALSGLRAALARDDDAAATAALAAHYERRACGAFGRFTAFRLAAGQLVGVENPDPVTFDDLIGYETQKARVIGNVEAFVEGRPYNNMLLYGDRGTGKSSSVKALLNRFASRKLRLVALSKEDTAILPELENSLARRGCRFILFIDDLSFEENELGYKAFKSAIEGNVRPQPDNILVCVTSNRRNIVKEVWREREEGDDVNVADALQEKRSLADRFGLTVTFSAPDKAEYMEIVKGIARRRSIALPEDELESLALGWGIRQSGRSGRAARQFVNHVASGAAGFPLGARPGERERTEKAASEHTASAEGTPR